MDLRMPSSWLVLALIMALTALTVPVYGQTINTPCNPSMLSTLTPCMNWLTNSSGNGTSPTADCCNSLKTLAIGGMDCLCLVVTGSVLFRVPINRTLAISLPRACNMPAVPLQCKAPAGVPVPAPGPISLSPGASPTGSIVPQPTRSAESPESDTGLNPPSSTDAPTATTGSPQSPANHSYSFSPSLVLLTLGYVIFKCY